MEIQEEVRASCTDSANTEQLLWSDVPFSSRSPFFYEIFLEKDNQLKIGLHFSANPVLPDLNKVRLDPPHLAARPTDIISYLLISLTSNSTHLTPSPDSLLRPSKRPPLRSSSWTLSPKSFKKTSRRVRFNLRRATLLGSSLMGRQFRSSSMEPG